MRWDQRLKEMESEVQQNGDPHRMVSQKIYDAYMNYFGAALASLFAQYE
jgi:hypothetical protein